MKVFHFLFVFIVFVNVGLENAHGMQTEDDIKHAMFMAKSPYVFSPLLHWQTLERREYNKAFYFVVNSFNPEKLSGEIAVFSSSIPLKELAHQSHQYGCFSDQAPHPPSAKLKYYYRRKANPKEIYFRFGRLKLSAQKGELDGEHYTLLHNYFLENFLRRTEACAVYDREHNLIPIVETR